jgi:two-component system NtrC family sensor kinase
MQPHQRTEGSVNGAARSAHRKTALVTGHTTADYFRRLRRRLEVGLALAYIVPLAGLSLYFHFQFNLTLKESGKLHLAALAESQRNTVDLFLQERVVNIFMLFHGQGFHLNPTPDEMQGYLQSLREASDAFIDVGFFGEDGVQIGYAGPYPYLLGRDYSREQWFTKLMGQERNYYFSDIYLGFRQKPHFTIAVKQTIDNHRLVMRATLDPDKLYLFLRTISRGKGVDSALINREGKYQVVDPDRGEPLASAVYLPPPSPGSGAEEVNWKGDPSLVGYAWLQEAPWVLVTRQPLDKAYAGMYAARRFMIVGTALLILFIVGTIWLITDRLLRRAQATEESREELRSQLLHAAKLVSVGELAAGVAHEINNPLAIIASESGLIGDMLDPQFKMDCSPEKIRAELAHIDHAVYRARGITQKLLSFVRKSDAKLAAVNLNKVLDEVVSGLKEREFKVANIQLIRDYDLDLPPVMVEADQMRQVFLNLINNAGDAIEGPGRITLTTRHSPEEVRVTVTDTGKGMTSEQMSRIFVPFFTTKEVGKGTGLGLAISLSIVQAMGGKIEVQSMPGAGSSFTVVLPLEAEGGTDA